MCHFSPAVSLLWAVNSVIVRRTALEPWFMLIFGRSFLDISYGTYGSMIGAFSPIVCPDTRHLWWYDLWQVSVSEVGLWSAAWVFQAVHDGAYNLLN